MSTILDALKKSEQERKRNTIPTLSDMPAPQERSKWPYWLAFFLLSLLTILLVWFFVLYQEEKVATPEVVVNDDSGLASNNTIAASHYSDEVSVSVISFAQEANARFAIINDKLFHEGEFIKAGIKVESILQDSVVLLERGERITLSP